VKLLLYIAIAFILWRIVRSFMRPAPPKNAVGGPAARERVIDPPRGAEIDYSKVQDASYREIRRRGDDETDRPDH
jgi:hypothetical protein